MTTDAYRAPSVALSREIPMNIAAVIAEWIVRTIMFSMYAILFGFTLITIAFIEIRQSNMAAFNSLIATLEQRDIYRTTPYWQQLENLREDQRAYRGLLAGLVCPTAAAAAPSEPASDKPALANFAATAATIDACTKVRNDIQGHYYSLSQAEDEILLKIGTLEQWYSQYRDGITQQAPQIIPALRLLDAKQRWLTALTRAPFEIMAMLLLVCMGALGGVIGLTRHFLEKNLPNPTILELFYRPALGAVVALGIYVLFRASQLFFTGTSQGEGTATTSIFVLAALGLASGVCASDAIGQIEALAARMLRRSAQAGSGETQADPTDVRPASPGPVQDGLGSDKPVASSAA